MAQNPPSVVFVGVDAGGSHTEALATGPTGTELGRVQGGPGALTPGRVPDAADQIAQTVLTLLGKIRCEPPVAGLCVGAAGAGRRAEREALEQALLAAGISRKVVVVTDGEIALESVFPKSPGILLLAGTGSVAYRREGGGAVRRAGGLGWQLGDEGGGYAIGRSALALAGRTLDGRGSAAPLSELLLERTAAGDLDGLIRWSQRATRQEVAGLAAAVLELAATGDDAARELVQSAASDLARLLLALGGTAPKGTGLALGGSLLGAQSPLRAELAGAISRTLPQLTLLTLAVDPARGAAAMARA